MLAMPVREAVLWYMFAKSVIEQFDGASMPSRS